MGRIIGYLGKTNDHGMYSAQHLTPVAKDEAGLWRLCDVAIPAQTINGRVKISPEEFFVPTRVERTDEAGFWIGQSSEAVLDIMVTFLKKQYSSEIHNYLSGVFSNCSMESAQAQSNTQSANGLLIRGPVRQGLETLGTSIEEYSAQLTGGYLKSRRALPAEVGIFRLEDLDGFLEGRALAQYKLREQLFNGSQFEAGKLTVWNDNPPSEVQAVYRDEVASLAERFKFEAPELEFRAAPKK